MPNRISMNVTVAKQTQGRAVFERITYHVRQEQAIALGVHQHIVAKALQQVRGAVNHTQVKEHTGQHQRLGR